MNRKTLLVLLLSLLITVSAIGFPLYFYYNKTELISLTVNDYNPMCDVDSPWSLNFSFVFTDCQLYLLPIKIDIFEEKLLVEIVVKAKYDRSIDFCSAMLVVHTETITTSFPSEGNWTVNCNKNIIYVEVN